VIVDDSVLFVPKAKDVLVQFVDVGSGTILQSH
jgi:hypothetical protein